MIAQMLFKFSEIGTPKTLSLATQKQIQPCLSKAEMAVRETFPALVQGTDYPYCSGADWSSHDLIFWFLQQIGPASLTCCTWSVAEDVTSRLVSALADGRLTRCDCLVDWRVQVRTPGFLAVAREKFGRVRVSSCHAKVFVLRNEEWAISCVGSANLTSNPRIEAGHISTSHRIAEFHERWIRQEIENAKPFGVDMRQRGKADGRG